MGILLKATSVFPVLVFLLSSSSCAIEYEFAPEEYRRSAQVRPSGKHHYESPHKDRYLGSGALGAYRDLPISPTIAGCFALADAKVANFSAP